MEAKKNDEVRHIRETNEYVVSGKVISGKGMTEAEKKRLQGAKEARIITGECAVPTGRLVV